VVLAEDLGFVRDGTTILNAVNWAVGPAQNWVVLGPNGCGKTTLLRMVSGWVFPSRGDLTVLGQRFGHCRMADLRARIGYVSHALESMVRPRLVALGVVVTGAGAGLGVYETPAPRVLAQAEALLEIVGVHHRRDLPFCLLSQGERMRVLIARALMGGPELLVLDEPCVGLDPLAREQVLATVEDLTRAPAGPTLILVTHHVEEIVPGITHVLGLRDGCVRCAGLKHEILRDSVLADFLAPGIRVQPDGDWFRCRWEHRASGGWRPRHTSAQGV
jgi:iron complex transport system ATP-binding protein